MSITCEGQMPRGGAGHGETGGRGRAAGRHDLGVVAHRGMPARATIVRADPRKEPSSPPLRSICQIVYRRESASTARNNQPRGLPNTWLEALDTPAMVAAEVATASTAQTHEREPAVAGDALVQGALGLEGEPGGAVRTIRVSR